MTHTGDRARRNWTSDPPPGSAEYDELEFLSVLIEAFKQEERDWSDASPQEIVEEMAHHGVSRGELAKLARWLDGRSRLSDFLKGVRELPKARPWRSGTDSTSRWTC